MSEPEPVPSTAAPSSLTPFIRALNMRDMEVVSHMRHALRTPLNQIIGYSELLIESADELEATTMVRDLKRIHTAGGQLLALINDALANWKVEAGTVNIAALRTDMRTPLNTIIGYAEICLDEANERHQAALVADLQKIHRAAKTLFDLFMSQSLAEDLNLSGGGSPAGTSAAATLGPDTPLIRSEPADIVNATSPLVNGRLLIVDDDDANRDMLTRRLQRLGFDITQAEDGQVALNKLKAGQFDVVLLDVVMPGLDGFQTLEYMRADAKLRHVPVIMLTALDDTESTVRCIEAGAADFVSKPFNPVILRARINASLEKKRLHDQEQAYFEQIQKERAKSERLLLNTLPKAIADRLKQGERTIVDSFAEATVVFADIVGFSRFAAKNSPARTVQLLNEIFSAFDRIAEHNRLEKIKTIGDSYMFVGGVPLGDGHHASDCAEAALEMLEAIRVFNRRHSLSWSIRIGMHSGPVVAGIIGTKKFAYDLWGDTVNVASRLESYGQGGRIQISAVTRQALGDRYVYEPVGFLEMKNVDPMETFYLTGRQGA